MDLRTPPNSEEAEKSVLGGMMLSEEAVEVARSRLSPADFYQHAHQLIYKAACRVAAEGNKVDAVTVSESLKGSGDLQESGGYDYLGQLINFVPHAYHQDHYVRVVQENSLRRRAIQAGRDVISQAYDQTRDIGEALALVEQSIHGAIDDSVQADGDVSVREVLDEVFDQLGRAREHGVPTGFRHMDRKIFGWQPGHLVVIAARPSAGKTAFACNLALGAAKNDKAVAIFSLEQSRMELAERLLSIESRVNSHSIKSGDVTDAERDMLLRSASRLSELPLTVDDTPGRSVAQIAARCRLKKRRSMLDLAIIDYLQLVEPEDKRIPREQQVAAMTRSLSLLARRLQVPVLILAQLNRSAEIRSDKKPKLSDLRESGAIEQDANMVLFVHRPWVYDANADEKMTQIVVAKNRDGWTGTVKMEFRPHILTFVESDDQSDKSADFSSSATTVPEGESF